MYRLLKACYVCQLAERGFLFYLLHTSGLSGVDRDFVLLISNVTCIQVFEHGTSFSVKLCLSFTLCGGHEKAYHLVVVMITSMLHPPSSPNTIPATGCFCSSEQTNCSGQTDVDYHALPPSLTSLPYMGQVNHVPLPPELLQEFESILTDICIHAHHRSFLSMKCLLMYVLSE